MRRTLLTAALAAACLALAGCGGGGTADDVAGTSTPPTTSQPATSTAATSSAAPAAFGRADIAVCQTYVSSQDEVYGYLTRLERDGSLPAQDAVKAKLDLLSVGGMASMAVDQVQSPALAGALRAIVAQAETVKQQLLAQRPITSVGLRSALDAAAEACEQGGFVIDWHR